MKLKGIDKFMEKTDPVFAGKRIALIPVYFLSLFITGLLVMTSFNNLPNVLSTSGIDGMVLAFLPLIGEGIVGAIGFVMVYQIWFLREKMKAKYGKWAYRRIFLVGFGGIILVLSMTVISFFPISGTFWSIPPFNVLVTSIDSYLGIAAPFIAWPRAVLGIVVSIIGLIMIPRSIITFGFDYTTVVYLYFPEESTFQDHAIYSALRHPMYSGGLTIALGGMIFSFTPYAILLYVTFLIGFSMHVRFVEEPELMSRFGDSYKEYRKKVPAFFVNPARLKTFFGFLFGIRRA
ncbi:MAG: isoprenylcysteine carboxylmethyltransferase family protein [Candidatus Lokiarchaeota archaeon]|nr:isoprenylcysteine carboxylmethyltransferase family protein [Candidatus Lokiarchaeota archaeon]